MRRPPSTRRHAFFSDAPKCDCHRHAVISHVWDEGVFALGPRILAAWPDDCEGAFIGALSLPQNFESGALIAKHALASESVAATPFSRVFSEATPVPKALVLIVSPTTPPMSRLWCALEVLLACKAGVASITAEGAPPPPPAYRRPPQPCGHRIPS